MPQEKHAFQTAEYKGNTKAQPEGKGGGGGGGLVVGTTDLWGRGGGKDCFVFQI